MNPFAPDRRLSIVLVAASLLLCAHVRGEHSLAGRVEGLVAPLVATHEFSGAIVLMRRGQVLYQGGFGLANRAAGTAFTPATASDGGSLAKTFTAAGLQWLAQEGRVELDAPVTRYLPEFPHSQTTLRHLISHSNGLPPYYEYFDPYFEPSEIRTTGAMLRVVAREEAAPAFEPGSRFEYSNFAFDLAALVIERVTEQKYEDFLRERFFSRLGMNASFARPARLVDWQGVRTMGYRWRREDWEPVDVFDMEAFLGSSNLYFSALDLARWASANAAGTSLPAAVFAAGQLRPRIDGQPSSITGLSWYCDDTGSRCYYTGDINAFHGFAYWDRKREEAAVFLSNSSLSPWNIIHLQRALVDVLAERSPQADSPVQFERLDELAGAVAGTYVSDTIGTVQISGGSGNPSVRFGAGLSFEAFPVSKEILYVPGPDYWLAFSGGQPPAAVHIRSMFLHGVARRTSQ